MRDPTGRLGLVRVAVPDDPRVVADFSTTPVDVGRVTVGPWPSLEHEAGSPAAGSTMQAPVGPASVHSVRGSGAHSWVVEELDPSSNRLPPAL
jgi:hypothetical protein